MIPLDIEQLRYYDGDIKQAPEVEFILNDSERFKDVNKLLRKYAEKMSESERIFLYIFSLFRTEVTENDFAGVFRHEMKDTKFNDVLVKMSELDFRDLINGLVDWRLISYDETKKTYTTHPVIKGYFESDFDEKNKKLCHKHIYQYFGEYAPEQPETLKKMQLLLFEQVYHGGAAGLYDDVLKAKPSQDSLFWDFQFSRSLEYMKIYQNIDKYPVMKNKRILMFNQKDESAIIITVIGQNVRKTEDVQISPTLKKFFENWNKADESTKYDYLTDKNYFEELLPFFKKMDDAGAESNKIILDGPQIRDYADILNLRFGGNLIIPTKHAVPEAIAKTLNWNEQVKFKTSDVVIVYSANPIYSETEQEGRIRAWKTWIEEINEKLVDKIELKIVESPEEVFQLMNEMKGKGVVVILAVETGEDGYSILSKGKFNSRDIENKIADNPERVTFFANCWTIKHEYTDAGSKTGAGINIGTTREVQDKEDIVEFLGLFTKELEKNGGNLLDASPYAINKMHKGRNYYFMNFAQEYLKENPEDIEGAIKYAKGKIKGKSAEGSSGIQIVIDMVSKEL